MYCTLCNPKSRRKADRLVSTKISGTYAPVCGYCYTRSLAYRVDLEWISVRDLDMKPVSWLLF